MPKKINYKKGDKLGPYNIEYLGEASERNKSGRRQGIFKCPLCGNVFVKDPNVIKQGKLQSCGCLLKQWPGHTLKDLTGEKINHLTVIGRYPKNDKFNKPQWICECDCGEKVVKSGYSLRKGIQSCGMPNCPYYCQVKTKARQKDVTGQRFGKLIALYRTEKREKDGECFLWHCKCDCGKEIDVSLRFLTSGSTKSCGCLPSYWNEKIDNILNKEKVLFEREKTFDTCRNPKTNKKLRFDFYIPKKNLLIEYNGEQHYHPIGGKGWFTPENFEEINYRDNIKKEWCKQNNYNLHIIPYTESSKINDEYIQNILSQYKDEVDEDW